MSPSVAALVMSVPLILLGLVSAGFQVRGMRQLRARTHVPSDEFGYLRNRHRRRLLAAGVIVTAGALIAGVYLSGLEGRADKMAEPDPTAPRDANGKRVMTDDEKATFRVWGGYVILVVVLVFVLFAIAVTDTWASRRYWLSVYREMREEHQTQLRRDLAVYKAQKDQGRNRGFGGRLGDG